MSNSAEKIDWSSLKFWLMVTIVVVAPGLYYLSHPEAPYTDLGVEKALFRIAQDVEPIWIAIFFILMAAAPAFMASRQLLKLFDQGDSEHQVSQDDHTR